MTTDYASLPEAKAVPKGTVDHDSPFTDWYARVETEASGIVFTMEIQTRVEHARTPGPLYVQEKREQNFHVVNLVDADGKIYAARGMALPTTPANVIPDEQSQVDVARGKLIDLASAWRRAGLQMETEHFDTARAVVYAECAKQLDELVVAYLSEQEPDCDYDDQD